MMEAIIKSYSDSSDTRLLIDDEPPDESDSLYFIIDSTDNEGKRIEGAEMIIGRDNLRYLKAIIEAFLNTPIVEK